VLDNQTVFLNYFTDDEMLVDNQINNGCPVDPDPVEARDPSNLDCDINAVSSDDDEQVVSTNPDGYLATEDHSVEERMQLRPRNLQEPETVSFFILFFVRSDV